MSAPDKARIRSLVLEQRNQMGAKQYQLYCRKILQRLLILPAMKSAQVVHCYYPMDEKREITTKMIFKMMWASDRTILTSKVHPGSMNLTHHEVDGESDLQKGTWGLIEPAHNIPFDTSLIDVIIVPMLAGDVNKNRLGYGKGYYDRFLAEMKAFKVGLCFEQHVFDALPVEAHDVPLDAIITQDRIIF